MFRYLILILCITTATQCYRLEENDYLLAISEGDISATVQSAVNTIAGDYVISQLAISN